MKNKMTRTTHLAEFKDIITNWVNAPKQPDIIFPANMEDDRETYEEAEYGELRSSCILPIRQFSLYLVTQEEMDKNNRALFVDRFIQKMEYENCSYIAFHVSKTQKYYDCDKEIYKYKDCEYFRIVANSQNRYGKRIDPVHEMYHIGTVQNELYYEFNLRAIDRTWKLTKGNKMSDYTSLFVEKSLAGNPAVQKIVSSWA
jgi:hypothetical protein